MAVLKKTTETDEPAGKKTAAKKTAAKKTAVKEATAKKAAASEKAAAKKTALEEKSEAKKAASSKKTSSAKKTSSVKKLIDDAKETAPKTTKRRSAKKAEPKINIVVEYAGKQVKAEDVIARVSEAYTAENPDAVVETMELYIQPEKNLVYYVVNGEIGKNTRVKI